MEYGDSSKEFQKVHAVRSGEVVIEIDNHSLEVSYIDVADDFEPFNTMKAKKVRKEVLSGNRNQYFIPYPNRKNGTNFVRSRFVQSRQDTFMYQDSNAALRGIDFIPGERIHIHLQDRIGRITDAIFDPENEEIYFRLIKASRDRAQKFFLVPGENVEVNLKTDLAYWNWIFWMRKIADGDVEHGEGPERHRGCATEGSRLCRPIQNIHMLPTMEEILKAGQVRTFLGPMSKDQADEFDAEHRLNDPDNYHPIDRRRGEVVLSPYLMGLETANID